MKIGILTYHRSHNFGALLQAIALRKVLCDMGNEVYFIDYWPDYHKDMYKVINWKLLRLPEGMRSLVLFAKNLWLYRNRKRRRDAFETFISKHILRHTAPYARKEFFDVTVYGSDQIWRKQPGLGEEFNPVYFGDNIISSNRSISYAASMGIIYSEDRDKAFLQDSLSTFSDVLVREMSLKNLLDSCGISASVVLDPTLLLKASDWKELFNLKSDVKSDYLLFYDLQVNSIDYSVVKEYASKRNLGIKVISGEPRRYKEPGFEYIEYADPEMFVDLFYNAHTVLTSSYHGLVFSLIFNKEFFTVFQSNQDRAMSLLSSLSLLERMLIPHTDRIPDLDSIDYMKVNGVLQQKRRDSLRLLSNALDTHQS